MHSNINKTISATFLIIHKIIIKTINYAFNENEMRIIGQVDCILRELSRIYILG